MKGLNGQVTDWCQLASNSW